MGEMAEQFMVKEKFVQLAWLLFEPEYNFCIAKNRWQLAAEISLALK